MAEFKPSNMTGWNDVKSWLHDNYEVSPDMLKTIENYIMTAYHTGGADAIKEMTNGHLARSA